jgi:hypothetical protein
VTNWWRSNLRILAKRFLAEWQKKPEDKLESDVMKKRLSERQQKSEDKPEDKPE